MAEGKEGVVTEGHQAALVLPGKVLEEAVVEMIFIPTHVNLHR